ncbi:50S ribosomal protein L24 [Candidatus Kapabacteria bacterium]|nr:50S ribosomal protein L24 [Candidatus Kapabacteria bacterium]
MKKKLKIKKGDTVQVIAGADSKIYDDNGNFVGRRTGRVLDVYPEKMRVLVEGVNIRKKHMRPSQQDQQGGIKEIPLPIHYSNVMLLDSDGKPTRIGYEIEEDKNGLKTKKRIARTNGSEIKNG